MGQISQLVLSTIPILIFSLPTNAVGQNHDVRKAYWGMSPLEVQLSEGKPPDYKGNNPGGKYHQLMYKIRSGPSKWHPSIARWRYYFKRNKLVKVWFLSWWKENQLGTYDNELQYYTKRANKDPKQVDTEKHQSHQWMINNRTVVRNMAYKTTLKKWEVSIRSLVL